ncbi:MAG: DUF5518 domain-containing protein [Haloplanus sp.]
MSDSSQRRAERGVRGIELGSGFDAQRTSEASPRGSNPPQLIRFSDVREGDTERAGVRAGLIGAVPLLWFLSELLTAASGAAGPVWFRFVAVGLGIGTILVAALFGFGLAALLGALGATMGDWVSKRAGRNRPPVAGN